MKKFLEYIKGNIFSQYHAHINSGKVETLYEHCSLVDEYAKKLIQTHLLEKVIEDLISELVKKNISSKNKKQVVSFIRSIFDNAIIYHDAGKLNPNFQAKKMKNTAFEYNENILASKHSKISAYFFFIKHLKKINNLKIEGSEKLFLLYLSVQFTYPILNHHSPIIQKTNFDFNNEFVDTTFKNINFACFKTLPDKLLYKIDGIIENNILGKLSVLKPYNQFPLFALLKLNYSLLTASDYLATTEFMNQWAEKPDLGILSKELKQKIILKAETSQSYNQKTYSELENYKLEFPKEQKNDNLNKLRQNLSVEVINGVRANADKNLFYIEAPTGGGKTNLSMLALAEFLRADLKGKIQAITKVFYVFPFTTLITQTHKSVKETLGLEDKELIQLHSKAGFHEKSSDGTYGKDIENYIDYLFVNYPFTLLSHIKFFDILKSNYKTANYLQHRLANSVVIIDELQTYDPKQWDKVIYFIDQYARFFNIKFILMSATLPKLDELLSKDILEANYKKPEFVNLIEDKDRYFQNPNFAGRISFNFDLIETLKPYKNDEEQYLSELHDYLLEKSVKYQENSETATVHTIIEFIFKKSASKFYKLFDNELFDELFLLSGTTLEPRRKEIINKLKSSEYRNKNILLVTTQVVEAGVDIDMDIGFKDSSLIDSDEQLAGRINRNVNKQGSTLYLFDFNDAHVIYGKDERYKQIKGDLSDKYQEILKTKNFDKVYTKVMQKKNELNKSPDFVNLKSYASDLKRLNFENIDENFKLIDSQNTSIYVPIEIDIDIPNSSDRNFSESELDFLKQQGKYNKGEKYVNGEKVWEVYEDIINNRTDDFTRDKIKMTIMQGILSKFSFSIFTYSKDFLQMKELGVGEEKFGYFYLNYENDVYDYKNGINDENFGKAIFF